jgi:ParB family transcriptional regulator, chromosome partitioning protein
MPSAPAKFSSATHSATLQFINSRLIDPKHLKASIFSLSVYGDPAREIGDLEESIRAHGILVPLVVAPGTSQGAWDVISGHRRLACALALDLDEVPCQVRSLRTETARRQAILEYNRQRRKSFTQLMREADALEDLWREDARSRRLANLRQSRLGELAVGDQATVAIECRDSDDRGSQTRDAGEAEAGGQRGRIDTAIARRLGLGGKDLYRQARAIWQMAQKNDARARSGVAQLDAGTKTIHAAYKDLRRRDRFTVDFRPTPYDVWPFRHDRAFGIPHPGSIPPAIIAHALHYYTPPGGLVVDPMAGGGTTVDVCQSMGRRCLAYDLEPTRPEIKAHDIRSGFPAETSGCDLVFCDPPYHTMLARKYTSESIASAPLNEWVAFLHELAREAFAVVRPGGYLALLLAPQTEKDLPLGHGYLDHSFLGYIAAARAGFLPERRISCPMDGGYLPQQVRQARAQGRMLGQVRDLLVVRRPLHIRDNGSENTPHMHHDFGGWLLGIRNYEPANSANNIPQTG